MALREILAHFGVEVDTEELEKANKAIDNFIGRLKELGTAVVGGEFAKQIFEFGERIAEQGDQLEKASIRLGISTDSLQALGYAAVQSGADMGQLTFALLTLQDKIGDALINKAGEGAKVFAKFGISVHDANGKVKDSGDLLSDIADRIGKAKTQAEKTTIAMQFFGRQGKALLPLLEGGSEGLAKLREEFEALGGGMREDAIKAAAKYTDAMGRLHVVHDGLTGQIGVVLLPVLGRLIDEITKMERSMIDLAAGSSIVQTVIGGLGAVLTVFAVKSAIAFAPWILWAAALGAVVLIIEDLVTMFRGGDSVAGRILDSIGGAGTHVEVVKELGDAWRDIKETFNDIREAIKPFWDFLKWVAEHDSSIRLIRQFSNAIGNGADSLAQYQNNKTHAQATALGFDQAVVGARDTRVAQTQAGLMNNALANGERFVPTETPAFYAKRGEAGQKEWLTVISQWGEFLKRQNQQVLTATPLGMAPGMGVFHQTNHISVDGAGDPAKTVKLIDEHLQKRHAAAAHVLHKKVEKK